jgi:fructose-1,6-bisphosphatase/sedoheptulose 1,7-bisphosphatase-like protein
MLEIVAVPPQPLPERILALEIVRVTEWAAVSAVPLRGHGNKIDQAAVDAIGANSTRCRSTAPL